MNELLRNSVPILQWMEEGHLVEPNQVIIFLPNRNLNSYLPIRFYAISVALEDLDCEDLIQSDVRVLV